MARQATATAAEARVVVAAESGAGVDGSGWTVPLPVPLGETDRRKSKESTVNKSDLVFHTKAIPTCLCRTRAGCKPLFLRSSQHPLPRCPNPISQVGTRPQRRPATCRTDVQVEGGTLVGSLVGCGASVGGASVGPWVGETVGWLLGWEVGALVVAGRWVVVVVGPCVVVTGNISQVLLVALQK